MPRWTGHTTPHQNPSGAGVEPHPWSDPISSNPGRGERGWSGPITSGRSTTLDTSSHTSTGTDSLTSIGTDLITGEGLTSLPHCTGSPTTPHVTGLNAWLTGSSLITCAYTRAGVPPHPVSLRCLQKPPAGFNCAPMSAALQTAVVALQIMGNGGFSL